MKHLFFSTIFICVFILTGCELQMPSSNTSKSYYSDLSLKNVKHKLYQPDDQDVPHPISVYNYRAKDKIYPYEDACGSGSYLFDPEKNELHYAISYCNLSGVPIMMHFHLGSPEVEGPIIQTIFGEPYTYLENVGTSTRRPLNGKKAPNSRAGFVKGVYKLQGNLSLNPPLTPEEEKEKLLNGEIYVNIHTYLNEAGELRGQILPCGQ